MVSKWPLQMSGPAEGRSDLRVGRGAGGFGTSPDREPAGGSFYSYFTYFQNVIKDINLVILNTTGPGPSLYL